MIQLERKLASSRGRRSPIIAPQKPNSLSLLSIARRDAEEIRCGDDHVDLAGETLSVTDRIASSSTGRTTNLTTYSNYFASCEALLKSAGSSSFQTKTSFSSSKSVFNIRESLVKEKGYLTDVHCGARAKETTTGTDQEHPEDEVEIVSLLEEQIPKYKLRADTITKFGGCSNQDFLGIPYPVLQDYTPVTPEQAYLTLGYFLLSGERVSQMTKTFCDVDAVQKLLEEKEKDLELAARIGQQLLEQNRSLEERLECLESDYKDSTESVTQLKHELLFKSQLLELYDNGPSEENSKAATPIPSLASVLERRMALLEEENNCLRTEACRIVETVEKAEAEEKYLVDDAIKRLGEVNSRMTLLSDDLQRKTEETSTQQDEILTLVSEVKMLRSINKEIYADNLDLQKTVETLKTSQHELSAELADLKDNYIEVVAILKETQEQLRVAQKQKESGMDVISVFDSLAYEIESSVAKQRRSSDYFRRCFDMVRSVNNKIPDMSMNRTMMSSGASSGYHSGFSGDPSLELSAAGQDLMVLVNPATLSITNSELLNSSISLCGSPGVSTPGWRIPEKLQIVKPIEGSSTLQVWSSLATPHLGNLLETRPGVQMRVETNPCQIGCNAILALTGPEQVGLQNFTSTAPVFTFVTTSTNWQRRDSTTTVYTNDISSNFSTYSLSSRGSSPIPSSHVSASGDSHFNCKLHELDLCKEYGQRCETPQNSPVEGNSRPCSPTNCKQNANQSFRTLYGIYDSLVAKLSVYGNQSALQPEITKPKSNLTSSSSKIESADMTLAVNRQRAPPKPGTGILERILSDSLS